MTTPAGTHCAGCNEKIYDKFVLIALEKNWHEECLRCSCCRTRLGDGEQKLFFRDGMLLCRSDYTRLYMQERDCAGCKKKVRFQDMVMRARDKVYHLDCFQCTVCSSRFCVGDRFRIWNGQLLCEYDYEEKSLFHSASFNNDKLDEITKNFQQLSEFDMVPDCETPN